MRLLKIVAIVVLDVVLIGAALWFFAPRETWTEAALVAPVEPGADLDAWLAAREGVFSDLTPDTEKTIVWAGEVGARTPLALVYLHGFSATRQEIAPVPQQMAEALGANLFLTRFAGHGRPGVALGDVALSDWETDLREAMAIGARLGERVVLIGTSTGGSLAVLAALDPEYRDQIAGIVLVSPNFDLNNPQSWLMDLPFARDWVPLVVGESRSWQPHNDQQALYWTTTYPNRALFPMRAAQRAAQAADHAAATVPALVFYAQGDQVVLPAATEAAMANWGAPVAMHVVTDADDPSQHVIAGDILSPTATPAIVATTLDWLRAL